MGGPNLCSEASRQGLRNASKTGRYVVLDGFWAQCIAEHADEITLGSDPEEEEEDGS